MKKLLVLAVLCMTGSVFAQICRVDMIENRSGRILQTFDAYDYNGDCFEGMKECRKQIRLTGWYGRADCVQSNGNPGPIPQPIPQPIPRPNPVPQPLPTPLPIPRYEVSATVLIENVLFNTSGRDASELFYNCMRDLRVGSADDIFFTVNGNRYKSAHTSGWYNEQQICSILEQEARQSNRFDNRINARVTGSLENQIFRFEGYDRVTLLNSCLENIEALRAGSTDDLTYSLNGSPRQVLHTSGWWNNPADVCRTMLIDMEPRL